MQTGQALRLVHCAESPVRHRAASRPRPERRRPRGAGGKTRGRAPASAGRAWLKPLVTAIIVAGEWLVLAAEVFVRVYLFA